jgi:3-hydroxyacyl-[acyl-carrier-protein] dehydratase
MPPQARYKRNRVRFHLLDRIESVTDDRLVAVKAVSLAEEYLADHFPSFPVLPGVLMLEAATQAAAWLAFRRTHFACTVAVLKAARNIRYGHFVSPGRTLRITASYEKAIEGGHAFRVEAAVETAQGTATAITGKLELACFRLAQRCQELAGMDERLLEAHRARWADLTLSAPALALRV